MTDSVEPPEGRSRSRLNLALSVAVLLCLAVDVVGWSLAKSAYERSPGSVDTAGFWDAVSAVVADERTQLSSTRAGRDLGDATVVALPPATDAEQERFAAVIGAASDMADAFLNVSHDDLEASFDAVRSLATGAFLRQYEKSIKSIAELARRARSTQTGEVLWAGVTALDDDSAVVLVASSGSVANKATEFEAQPRNYRLRLDLALEDGRWLTRDLQFVS